MRGEISIEFTFDTGHRIVGHKGKCARLHGHTYKIHVMAAGPVKDPGFVVDFGDIKAVVNEWDHRFLVWDQDPLYSWLSAGARWTEESGGMGEGGPFPNLNTLGILAVQFNPTAELMAAHLADRIKRGFLLDAVMVELWETPKSMARYISDEMTVRDFTEMLRD
jgi:6-pyruvoyltetrahydropterin/6-carboxytetrahydropterin synthase